MIFNNIFGDKLDIPKYKIELWSGCDHNPNKNYLEKLYKKTELQENNQKLQTIKNILKKMT